MTRRRLDPMAAVTSAEINLAKLYDRREAALEGKGPAPHPDVIRAAERDLEAARHRLRKAIA